MKKQVSFYEMDPLFANILFLIYSQPVGVLLLTNPSIVTDGSTNLLLSDDESLSDIDLSAWREKVRERWIRLH